MGDPRLVYPLQQVITVKENRVKEQEKVVAEKREALEKEKQKLKDAEQARDKVKEHYKNKLTQMRETMDAGTTSPEILQMKVYVKLVQEKLVDEEKKVKDQEGQVEIAEKNVEAALEVLRMKRQEVDKLLTHRKDWTKEAMVQIEKEEAVEQDEMGSIIFVGRHRSK